jgi:hypothetical protein
MVKSIAFAAEASRLAALLLSCIPADESPASRFASGRLVASIDLAIPGPFALAGGELCYCW